MGCPNNILGIHTFKARTKNSRRCTCGECQIRVEAGAASHWVSVSKDKYDKVRNEDIQRARDEQSKREEMKRSWK